MSGAWDEVLLDVKDWVATIAIGYLIPSFWRGTWVLFDIWLCGQPADAGLVTGDSFCFAGIIEDTEIALHRKSGWISLLIGVSLTAIGVVMMWMGLWRPKVVDIQDKVHLPWTKTALRIIMVYILGVGAVNWWRGVWYLTDYFLLPNNLTANEWGEWPLTSFWTASVVVRIRPSSDLCHDVAHRMTLTLFAHLFLADSYSGIKRLLPTLLWTFHTCSSRNLAL